MKKKILFITLCFFSSLISERSFAQATLSVVAPEQMDVVPGVLYLQFKAKHGIDFEHLSPTHTGNAEVDNLFASISVTDIYPLDPEAKKYAVSVRHGTDRMYIVNFSGEGISPREIGHDFLKLDAIEGASPRFIFHSCYTPNDPQVANQYALDNMRIKDAWGYSKGSSGIIIADLDEGVNYTHEDLAAHIYKIDGHFGYDIVGDSLVKGHYKPDTDPMPGPGQNHGTMTSGCFGAVPDNNIGIAGSGFNCQVMAIKIADNNGTLIGGYDGMHYAVTHGAKILNCSWGGYENDPQYIAYFQTFIDEALDTGALVIASAGNDGVNIDDSTFIPASLNGVFSIGASAQSDKYAAKIDNGQFSTNYGSTVGAYAPGVDIVSTSFPGNSSYATEDGTSFSCPLTSGVAGLLWAKHLDWTPKFIERQIISTCDNVVNPSNRAKYWGRVNALSAVSLSPTIPGLSITDFSIDGVDKGGLQYSDKVYSVSVKFENIMGNGNGIVAKLLPVDGSVLPNGGYTVQLGTSTLGTMNSLQQTSGTFKFTRDGYDQGAGSQLSLYFGISYGGSTVENQKYYDTLRLDINITGDDPYVAKGVAEENSNILQLGNSYPNPATDDASIDFELAHSGYVKLELRDVLGRSVNILADGVYEAGKQSVHCDARVLPNGIYFYSLETSDGTALTKRMIVAH